ncbi:MAG: hypothetical protein A2075_09150 [Geobacteraceae bacterium GWC2_58_44]|nr:MAG: hypothetical protein A2075_09150 [Geobacteraceae bacterium GWC2_58_44]HBG07680.1 hypothetical protein [Geobacter sp.]
MRKGNLTREQAVAVVGEAAVAKVEADNCDYTSRVQTDGDTGVEFSASVKCTDKDGDDCVLVAYYYQEPEDLDGCEDLGNLDWTIEGYEII